MVQQLAILYQVDRNFAEFTIPCLEFCDVHLHELQQGVACGGVSVGITQP